MTGAPTKKPWWVLSASRGASWFFAVFYTVFGVAQAAFAVSDVRWWGWLIAGGWIALAGLAWLSLGWVLRHPEATAGGKRDELTRSEDRDGG